MYFSSSGLHYVNYRYILVIRNVALWLRFGKTKQNITYERCSLPTNHNIATFFCVTVKRTKGGPLWAFRVKLVSDDMAVCFSHADSFGLDHFDQNFHLIIWLKVNNDTVFEASILEYDRYESPLGAWSCHRYLEF